MTRCPSPPPLAPPTATTQPVTTQRPVGPRADAQQAQAKEAGAAETTAATTHLFVLAVPTRTPAILWRAVRGSPRSTLFRLPDGPLASVIAFSGALGWTVPSGEQPGTAETTARPVAGRAVGLSGVYPLADARLLGGPVSVAREPPVGARTGRETVPRTPVCGIVAAEPGRQPRAVSIRLVEGCVAHRGHLSVVHHRDRQRQIRVVEPVVWSVGTAVRVPTHLVAHGTAQRIGPSDTDTDADTYTYTDDGPRSTDGDGSFTDHDAAARGLEQELPGVRDDLLVSLGTVTTVACHVPLPGGPRVALAASSWQPPCPVVVGSGATGGARWRCRVWMCPGAGAHDDDDDDDAGGNAAKRARLR